MSDSLAPARFTDAEFERMVARGAFAGLGRIELRRGALHRMSPQFAPHALAKMRLVFALSTALARAGLPLQVVSEATVKFASGFEPMPDVFLWEGGVGRGPFAGAEVRLVIEVADTTLADDLGEKREDYAKAGLAEYWVADLAGARFHCFAGPGPEGFAQSWSAPFAEAVGSATLPGLLLPAATLG